MVSDQLCQAAAGRASPKSCRWAGNSVIAVEIARVFGGDMRSAGGAGSGAGIRRGGAFARRCIVPMGVRSAFSASGSGGAVAVSAQRRGASGGAAAAGARKRRGCADYRRAEPWASLRVPGALRAPGGAARRERPRRPRTARTPGRCAPRGGAGARRKGGGPPSSAAVEDSGRTHMILRSLSPSI